MGLRSISPELRERKAQAVESRRVEHLGFHGLFVIGWFAWLVLLLDWVLD
jgi:hypothetical protein